VRGLALGCSETVIRWLGHFGAGFLIVFKAYQLSSLAIYVTIDPTQKTDKKTSQYHSLTYAPNPTVLVPHFE
jgi:hypothetical protein